MVICDSKKCTGCYACVTVCAHSAISMHENAYGELHPIVDDSKCKKCGLCQKVCPNNIPPTFYTPIKCYASWILNQEEREKCASGGLATAMSKFVLEQGGVVFGTAYNQNLIPSVTYIEDKKDVERFKGSKYAQSIIGEKTFKQVKLFLLSERLVLFIGTPCQIAGLKGFLQKDYQNLITVDLICHGVCPTTYFKEEIKHLTSKFRIHQPKDIRFRGNDKYNYNLSIWQESGSESTPAYVCSRFEQPYFIGFRLGITLRENCYTCNYARPERIGDITIGDFLRLGREKPFPYKVQHPSVVLINDHKGEEFYNQVLKYHGMALINVERDYTERLAYKPSLIEPFKKHSKTNEFRQKYLSKGYPKAIRSTLRTFIWKEKTRKTKKQIISYAKSVIKSILR